jgi:hypothetical protein
MEAFVVSLLVCLDHARRTESPSITSVSTPSRGNFHPVVGPLSCLLSETTCHFVFVGILSSGCQCTPTFVSLEIDCRAVGWHRLSFVFSYRVSPCRIGWCCVVQTMDGGIEKNSARMATQCSTESNVASDSVTTIPCQHASMKAHHGS